MLYDALALIVHLPRLVVVHLRLRQHPWYELFTPFDRFPHHHVWQLHVLVFCCNKANSSLFGDVSGISFVQTLRIHGFFQEVLRVDLEGRKKRTLPSDSKKARREHACSASPPPSFQCVVGTATTLRHVLSNREEGQQGERRARRKERRERTDEEKNRPWREIEKNANNIDGDMSNQKKSPMCAGERRTQLFVNG